MEERDLDSTLLRRGQAATTFGDMVAFAEMLESRAILKILEELPGIARMSDAKFAIATNVLRRRFRGESPVDQLQLRVVADEVASASGDRDTARKIRELFQYDQA